MQKRPSELNARECGIKEEFNQAKWRPHYFVEQNAISLVFEVIKHQYIDIHYTKNQAENMFTACSFLLLKTPFHFISYCISEPCIESRLFQLGNERDNYIFTLA